MTRIKKLRICVIDCAYVNARPIVAAEAASPPRETTAKEVEVVFFNVNFLFERGN